MTTVTYNTRRWVSVLDACMPAIGKVSFSISFYLACSEDEQVAAICWSKDVVYRLVKHHGVFKALCLLNTTTYATYTYTRVAS